MAKDLYKRAILYYSYKRQRFEGFVRLNWWETKIKPTNSFQSVQLYCLVHN